MHTVTALQGEKAGTLGKSISKQLGQAELALVPGFTWESWVHFSHA